METTLMLLIMAELHKQMILVIVPYFLFHTSVQRAGL